MTEKIGASVVLEVLERIVAQVGEDHTATVCSIVEKDAQGNDVSPKRPACIVGYAIYDLAGDEKFQHVEGGFVHSPVASVGLHLTEAALSILSTAQYVQDSDDGEGSRTTWGVALKAAQDRAAEIGEE